MENSISKVSVSENQVAGKAIDWEYLRHAQSDSLKLPVYCPEPVNHELYYRRGYRLYWRNSDTKKKTLQFTVTKEEFETSGLKIGDIKMINVCY